MARVIPSQRWGVPAGATEDIQVHVKNGWLPLKPHGWRINSIGSFAGTPHRRQHRGHLIVILIMGNPDKAYGVATVEGAAFAINRGLNPGLPEAVALSTPSPTWGLPDEPIPPAADR